MTELVISDNQIIRATKGLDALISSYQNTTQFHMSDGRDELLSTISKSFHNMNIVRSLLKVLVDFRWRVRSNERSSTQQNYFSRFPN